ncbi:MAG: Rrf2 family transcriptional regulator [Gammaproteobacteria bacterium]|nr:Rrf2 family transcriptional regulator [Gammaproteobacteria bacterium]
MKLSTKGRHAVTAMMELALQHNKGPVTLADISAQQSISISYLEQLFARLRQHGLVTGMRGPGGGYCLARPAAEITIASILATVDDVSRREEMPHTQGEIPAGAQMWLHLSNRIFDFLNSITLEEVVTSSSDDSQESLFGSDFKQTAA